MKKLYRIVLLLLALIFLTTYNPSEFNVLPKKTNTFFKIQNIEVINNRIIASSTINKKLFHVYGKNILFIKREDLEEPLKTIDFLEKIEVKKKYPNSVLIKIYETKPIAILFKKNTRYIIDSSSNLITSSENIVTDDFPNVFGENAEQDFISFFNLLKKYNFPAKRIKNYYYFQIGRWDLQLLNDQIIKFPVNNVTEVISQSIELLNRIDFKKYSVIDLRVDGKIVVE